MSANEVLAASASDASSGPAAVGGRRRRGGAKTAVVAGDVPVMGGRHMTRKQRASVKKVARALKAANKKAFRLAMTLKKKLRR